MGKKYFTVRNKNNVIHICNRRRTIIRYFMESIQVVQSNDQNIVEEDFNLF